MVQNINQFAIQPSQGDKDLAVLSDNVISVQLDASSADIVPGEAVQLVDDASKLPTVTALTADTDSTFGFAVRNNKDSGYTGGDRLEIAIQGTVMYMTAGAAIVRGAQVEVDASEVEVITAAGTNDVVGVALDKAAAAGDLIRVIVGTPALT